MIIAILIAKILTKILNFFGRGATTFPGKIALRLKPNILRRLSENVEVICVTGTNGKTTVCALISYLLEHNACSYFVNKGGANMITGVAAAFINNSSVFGRCKCRYAVLECDENSLPAILSYVTAEVIVVTNVFRDQLDRYGEVTETLSKVAEGISYCPDAVLVLNGDCPLTFSLSHRFDNSCVTFGISDSYTDGIVSDSRYCPFCNSVLDYNYTVYSQLGDFYCSRCGYKRMIPDFAASDIIDLGERGSSFFVSSPLGEKYVSSSLGGIYNVYNYLCACAVGYIVGTENTDCLSSFSGAFGRMERFEYDGHSILLLLVKNPVGLSNCIRYVSKLKNDFDVCFALNDNDADGRDVSWIWDADFEPISYKNSHFVTTGLRAYDMALRLKYSGIDTERVIDGEDYSLLAEYIKSSHRDFVIMSTYTSMMNMRREFVSQFGGKEFWK